MTLFIGLMSGTSMDGIDAALVDTDTNTLIAGVTRPYGKKAKQWLKAVLNNALTSPAALSQLNTLLGREFAAAVEALLDKAHRLPRQVVAIGSHGQTICHDATADIPYTVQLGCAHTIAELTGIAVVADFRARDLVNGGQGAPFAPLYHQALFSSADLPLAVVNIGGIANVTYLAGDAVLSGYDIGPGNCLLDQWVQQHLGIAYDKNGDWAKTGQVIRPLLSALLADPYFKLPAPKSLGKEYFSATWLNQFLNRSYAAQDVQATLVALTAITIADAINNLQEKPRQVAICGGGVHNAALFRALAAQLPDLNIVSTTHLGIDPDYIEAMMFAWLADKAIQGITLDLRHITGAKHSAILGAIYAAGIDKRNSIEV